MKNITVIFLLAVPVLLSGADFISHPDMEQYFALRRLTRYIHSKFRASGRTNDVEIVCSEMSPPGEPALTRRKGRWKIEINPGDNWLVDHAFCRKLSAILLSAKCGVSQETVQQLPDWFVLGITQVVAGQLESARLIRNQQSFPLLGMLSSHGCFGDPADILELKFSELSAEEQPYYLEYAKLIMLTLERGRAVSRLAAMLSGDAPVTPASFNAAARRTLPAKFDPMISPAYRREMWSDMIAPPEALTLGCLDEVENMTLPELDAEGVPTGKIIRAKLEELPQLAARPDYLLLCRRAADRLFVMSVGEERPVRKRLADLRYHFEQDISRGANYDMTESSQAPPQISGKKSAGKSAKKPGADKEFNELMKKSRDKDFRNNMQKFYRTRVLNDTRKTGVAEKAAAFFAGSTQLDASYISSMLKDIRSELDLRKRRRQYLDRINMQRFPVRRLLKHRIRNIREGDIEHVLWLNSLSERY